jgi:hypothetical protein
MSNSNNQSTPKSNGLGTLLTTLASSGDNWVKLLIVGGLFINTVMTKNNGTGIKDTDKRLDYLRETVAKQVRVMYDNQNFLFDFVDEARAAHDRMETQMGIPHPHTTPFPRQQLPDLGYPYPYP